MSAGDLLPQASQTVVYIFPLYSNKDERYNIQAVGLDLIARFDAKNAVMTTVYDLFPHLPEGSLKRPDGG